MQKTTLLKSILILCVFIFLATIPLSEAARVSISFGSSYGPNMAYSYGPNVVYIPGHWYYGYWVPGQYVEYASYPPALGYFWYEGGFDGGHHWHRGHWGHRHH